MPKKRLVSANHASFDTKYVFLCGPITGRSPEEAMNWRKYVISRLPPQIRGIDPMRDTHNGVRHCAKSSELTVERLMHGKAVVSRDRFDVQRSHLLLANFLGADAVSIGAVGEIFWADLMRTPVMIVREKSGNPHDHDMINEIASWIFHDLNVAIAKIEIILAPDRR
ncbi:MAG: hypothetical protein AB7P69_25475 [Candidatus Binatia bacterium]